MLKMVKNITKKNNIIKILAQKMVNYYIKSNESKISLDKEKNIYKLKY